MYVLCHCFGSLVLCAVYTNCYIEGGDFFFLKSLILNKKYMRGKSRILVLKKIHWVRRHSVCMYR